VSEERRGTTLALAAYLMWGVFPLYWPLLEPAGALEILAHRVVWSFVAVAALLMLVGRGAWRRLPRDRRRLTLLSAAAILIGINWGLYIWGVNNHHVVDTSLGYFINPLVSVAIGVLLLGERLRPAQWSAVGIAAGGVVVLTVESGHLPWLALTIAVSFGLYGLVKKIVGVGAVEGLVVETSVLSPVALVYLIVLASNGSGGYTQHGAGHALLLMSAGAVTAAPLLAFAGGAARIPLSRLGLLQFGTPTIQFLIGVLYRHEPLPLGKLIGFILVWVALTVFTIDTFYRRPIRVPDVAPELSVESVT
jgi:chloramphenicol-sensitive protein RarD